MLAKIVLAAFFLLTSFLVSVPGTAPRSASTILMVGPIAASADSPGVVPLVGPGSWTLMGTQPPPRDSAGWVFASKEDRFILFGGHLGSNVYTNSTWSYDYDTNTWTNVSHAVAPSPRGGFGMAYDSRADRVVLFGGDPNDTWVLDPTTYTWTQRFPSRSPPRLASSVMVYDARADRTIVFGDTVAPGFPPATWTYDYASNAWSPLSVSGPGTLAGERMAYDPSAGRDLLFGGQAVSGEFLADTWSLDYTNLTWTNRAPLASPPGRAYHSLAFDAAASRLVLFGGTAFVGAVSVAYADTWAYDYSGNTWSNETVAYAPSPRYLASMDYDSTAHVTVLFGGMENGGLLQDDAWSYQLAAVIPPTRPQALVATAGVAQVDLTWTSPYSDGGSSVTAYKIYRGTESGAETYLATSGPTPSYTDRAVQTAATYYYEVAAVNSAGEGALSAEAHATLLPDTVSPLVTITSPANNSVLTSGLVTVSGAAMDNVGLERVEVSVDGSTWTLASGTTSWSANLTLRPGANTVYARATDTSGSVRIIWITVTLQSNTAGLVALDSVVLMALVAVVAVAVLAVALALRRRRKKPESRRPTP